jgi:hypothetical protein
MLLRARLWPVRLKLLRANGLLRHFRGQGTALVIAMTGIISKRRHRWEEEVGLVQEEEVGQHPIGTRARRPRGSGTRT